LILCITDNFEVRYVVTHLGTIFDKVTALEGAHSEKVDDSTSAKWCEISATMVIKDEAYRYTCNFVFDMTYCSRVLGVTENESTSEVYYGIVPNGLEVAFGKTSFRCKWVLRGFFIVWEGCRRDVAVFHGKLGGCR
jgi:hypothetical protein